MKTIKMNTDETIMIVSRLCYAKPYKWDDENTLRIMDEGTMYLAGVPGLMEGTKQYIFSHKFTNGIAERAERILKLIKIERRDKDESSGGCI